MVEGLADYLVAPAFGALNFALSAGDLAEPQLPFGGDVAG
jgi:hypothetical protein